MLAMFPGQGSQTVGMGKSLLSEFPSSKVTFEEAEDATKLQVRKLCFEGPEDELKMTANTQPCILTVSVAIWRVLVEETGIKPDLFAGHSLGEYSALVAAGKLDFARAAFLVRRRGEAMQEAVPAGVGGMAAIMKCPVEKLEAICREQSKTAQMVEVVNYNSDAQLVIAGHKDAVETVVKAVEAEGGRAVILPVSAPFHSKLMEPARLKMTPLLQESTIVKNATKIIPNLTAEVTTEYPIENLIKQIDNPVLWMQSFANAMTAGMDTYLEVGPGKVLFGLARRALPRGETTLMATEELKETITQLQEKMK